MIDDARLKALELTVDAKKAVNEVLPSAGAADATALNELRECLEEIEEDLQVIALDEHHVEVEAYQHRLLEIDSRLDKKSPTMKEISRQVEGAAKAVGIAAEVVARVAIPPQT